MENPVHELYVKRLQGIINANQIHFKESKEVNKCVESEEENVTLEKVFKISDDSDY